MNRRSIGIEHEWYQGIHPSEALYAKSAALVKDICQFYNIPIDSAHIIPHNQVVPTGCPNEINVAHIIELAVGTPPPVDTCPADLISMTAERDRLNGIITGKDEVIAALQVEMNTKVAVEVAKCQALQTRLDNMKSFVAAA